MLDRNSLKIILRYFLYILAVLPVFIFRDFTFDNELRYLSIADEALRKGSLFTFTNHGLFYADKPPLYLWLVMLGKIIFGNHVLLFLGIFSFLPALIIMRIMDKWVKDVISESERLTGELMLITSGYFIGAALVLRMDMLMCMFIVLALYTFYKMYRGESDKRDAILFPAYIFLAIFSKGPVGIMVPLLSTVVFLYSKGEIKTIGKYWGWKTLIVLLLLCLVWFTGVYIEGGRNYLNNLLFNQTVNRAINSFHHKEPIYYYLLTIWYSLAPWSLLYVGILFLGLKKKMAKTDLERFFLIIILSTFIILSFISAKLQIYLLPIFPFVTYLTILWLAKLPSGKWIRLLIGIPSLIFCAAFPAAIIAQMLIGVTEYFTLIMIFIATLILSVTGFLTIRGLKNRELYQSIIMMGCGLLIAIFIVSFAIPAENSFIGMGKLCEQAKNESLNKDIKNYYSFNIDRSENLDVYLSKEPKNLTEEDLLRANTIIRKPAILFAGKKDVEQNNTLQKFVSGKNRYQVGNYYYIVFE